MLLCGLDTLCAYFEVRGLVDVSSDVYLVLLEFIVCPAQLKPVSFSPGFRDLCGYEEVNK